MVKISSRTQHRKLDVLLVDDDAFVRRALFRALARSYEVREVTGVDEALLAIELRAPTILVTDLDMPDGGGVRLLDTVSKSHPAIVRIVFSGASEEALASLVAQKAAHASVAKGSSTAVLRDVIRSLSAEPEE